MTGNAFHYFIEDNRVPKAVDDPTLSPRAKEIIKRVTNAHTRWIEMAKWNATALGYVRHLNAQEAIAAAAYEGLRKKLTWPAWSTSMTDDHVKRQMFAIQATYARMRRLVPESFQ